ncbi:rho guanine nucleotide exchange factor 7-like protein [Leptotrombidium deliense]|uniref:Rho guanine nucleotide exchange factor 7-like protein n=1 Tax=Leptotrombidium deliense TaxID=299467 RepID=A0A443SJR7_9ACAR|nr:rho guanine nucleotide exchange factor 7-like protein [Leptotrombidium deliense]
MDRNSMSLVSSGTPRTVKAIYNFKGDNNDELCLKKGDIIILTQCPSGGWWEGTLDEQTGWFPSNYVKDIDETDEPSSLQSLTESVSNEQSSQEYRNFVYHEMISSESEYIKQLKETLHKYLYPLQSKNIFREDEITPILSAISDILSKHSSLLQSLEQLKPFSNKERRIGRIFMQVAPAIEEVHLEYCSNHVKFVHLIEKKKDEVCKLISNVNSNESSAGSVTLISSLSSCFRRLDKYPAILQELQRYTDEAHADRGDTQRAVFVYRDIVTSCLQMRRQKEMELEVMLGNVKNWPENDVPIENLGSAVNMGAVTVVHPTVTDKEIKKDYYLVLFPCHLLLLYVSNEMTSFVFERLFHLNDVTLPRLPEKQSTKDTFDILLTMNDNTDGIAKYVFQCQSADEVRKWINLMHQCKSQNKSTLKKNLKERKIRDAVKSGSSSHSSGSSSALNKCVVDNAKRSEYWANRSLLSHPPIRCSRNDVSESDSVSESAASRQNDDMSILKVIEAYYLSGKIRKQAVSGVFESPQILLADEEKLMVENCKGNRPEMEERTLVDCVYLLQEEVKQMRAEISHLSDCLKNERKARKKLKSTVDKLCSHLNSI